MRFPRSNIAKVALFSAPLLTLGLMFAATAEARGHGGKKMTAEEHEAKFAERGKKMEKRVREKLAPKLELDESTTNRLVEILQDSRKEKRVAMMQVKESRKRLRVLVKDNANDAALDTEIAVLQKLLGEIPKPSAAFDDVKRILTPRQQAQFLLMNRGMMGHGRGHGKGMHGKRGRHGKRGMGRGKMVPPASVDVK